MARWRSPATRLRSVLKVASVDLWWRLGEDSVLKVAAEDRWRTACKAVITGDTNAKQR